jgi:two-component system, OmpR family, response regulator
MLSSALEFSRDPLQNIGYKMESRWDGADGLRVLLIEDDATLGEAVRDHVASADHAVDWMKTIDTAASALSTTVYGLVLLDLRLPDGSGIALLKDLRAKGMTTPVIILTAHDQISDRIRPVSVLRIGDLDIDAADRRVVSAGEPVALSGREWAVLDALAARPGAIVSKARIEEALYAFGSEIESNTVEVYVSRLRKKLGRDHIATLRGIGYRLGSE